MDENIFKFSETSDPNSNYLLKQQDELIWFNEKESIQGQRLLSI